MIASSGKAYLLVVYLSLYATGEIQNQAYWYVEVKSMDQCEELISGGRIDFGSVSSPLPDSIVGEYTAKCIEHFNEGREDGHL